MSGRPPLPPLSPPRAHLTVSPRGAPSPGTGATAWSNPAYTPGKGGPPPAPSAVKDVERGSQSPRPMPKGTKVRGAIGTGEGRRKERPGSCIGVMHALKRACRSGPWRWHIWAAPAALAARCRAAPPPTPCPHPHLRQIALWVAGAVLVVCSITAVAVGVAGSMSSKSSGSGSSADAPAAVAGQAAAPALAPARAPAPAQAPSRVTDPLVVPAGYDLLFDDEFDGAELDARKWLLDTAPAREGVQVRAPGAEETVAVACLPACLARWAAGGPVSQSALQDASRLTSPPFPTAPSPSPPAPARPTPPPPPTCAWPTARCS